MLESRRQAVLRAMGVTVWQSRARPAKPGGAALVAAGSPANPAGGPPDPWPALEAQVKGCQACPLHRSRTQTVFGTGNRRASWMLIGEAPGQQEDLRGEPFVGPAGALLNAMLAAVGAERDAVYIANTLKCRPPGNRDPRPEETAACAGFLDRQVDLIAPQLIVALGRIAAQTLLESAAPLGRLRGRVHAYRGIPLVATYHPAYLLRSPERKRESWQDLVLACSVAAPRPAATEGEGRAA